MSNTRIANMLIIHVNNIVINVLLIGALEGAQKPMLGMLKMLKILKFYKEPILH